MILVKHSVPRSIILSKKNSPATGIPCEVVPFSRGDTSQNILRNILCSEHLVEHKIQKNTHFTVARGVGV